MRVAAACFAVAGVVLGVTHLAGASPAEGGLEGLLASGAYGVAVASPGLVAVVARHPLTIVAAGIGGVMVAFLGSFGVTLPLAIPAVALAMQAARQQGVPTSPVDLARAVVVVLALPASVAVLFFVHEDPAQWSVSTPTSSSSGGTTDVTVWWESFISLLIVTAAYVVSSWSRPRPLSAIRPRS